MDIAGLFFVFTIVKMKVPNKRFNDSKKYSESCVQCTHKIIKDCRCKEWNKGHLMPVREKKN